jgi:hypothetical protein
MARRALVLGICGLAACRLAAAGTVDAMDVTVLASGSAAEQGDVNWGNWSDALVGEALFAPPPLDHQPGDPHGYVSPTGIAVVTHNLTVRRFLGAIEDDGTPWVVHVMQRQAAPGHAVAPANATTTAGTPEAAPAGPVQVR